MGPNQTDKLLHSKGNKKENKETIYRICKSTIIEKIKQKGCRNYKEEPRKIRKFIYRHEN